MKTIHMKVSVRGVLQKPLREFAKHWKNVLSETDAATGQTRFLSIDEARNWFFDQLAQGREYVSCGNCDNFDYKVGCLGHEGE